MYLQKNKSKSDNIGTTTKKAKTTRPSKSSKATVGSSTKMKQPIEEPDRESNEPVAIRQAKLAPSKTKRSKKKSGEPVATKQAKSAPSKTKLPIEQSDSEFNNPVATKQAKSAPSKTKRPIEESDKPVTTKRAKSVPSKTKLPIEQSDSKFDDPVTTKQAKSAPSKTKRPIEESDKPVAIRQAKLAPSKMKRSKKKSDKPVPIKEAKSVPLKTKLPIEESDSKFDEPITTKQPNKEPEQGTSGEVLEIKIPVLGLGLKSHDMDGIKFGVEGIPTFSDEDSDAGVFLPNHDGLRLCPECKEGMPSTISPYLASLIAHYCKLHRKKGSEYTVPVSRMGLDICNLLTREKKHDLALETAARKGWPVTNINFRLIPRRVRALSAELDQLVSSKNYLEHLFIWDAFKQGLAADHLSIKKFSLLRAGEINPSSNVAIKSEPG